MGLQCVLALDSSSSSSSSSMASKGASSLEAKILKTMGLRCVLALDSSSSSSSMASKGASSLEAKILKTMGLQCVLALDSSSSSSSSSMASKGASSKLKTTGLRALDSSSSSSTSSSSSDTYQWHYDVFLSFRGEDTPKDFIAHLYAALRQKGINTYINNDLKIGENISPALLEAIRESRISVIILSQNYASSSRCLDELAMILECKETKGQIVLPVFYNVDPSDVRYQRNSFGEAFVKYEKRFKYDQMKVQRWKTALTQVANLFGCYLGNRNEHDFIQELIEWVNSIAKETYLQVSKYPVGIESRVKAVKSLLDIKKKDSTCMVGIVGTGGIGKTTLAKAIYNSIASQFEGSCFLENIRETSHQNNGLIHLQNKLLSKILGGSSQMVHNVGRGVSLIENMFRIKRILLVLDDVDELFQLEMLAGRTDWFGLGSRIIITTRNKYLLCCHDQVSIYDVNRLDHDEALRLFSWHAFNSDKPDDVYVKVTKDAILYCEGLPLALTVLGSALKGRDILYWKSKLDEYKRIPNSNIQKQLQISFDGLDENSKQIFLDIACFFYGKNLDHVIRILDKCGWDSYIGIRELEDKSLISIDHYKHDKNWLGTIDQSYAVLKMNGLLQEMGREIVRQESPKNPGKRSRLWFHEDVRRVLEDNMGTNRVEGILLDMPKQYRMIYLSPKSFEKMNRLRLLINCNALFSEEPSFCLNELKLLDWPHYPGESLPSNFCGKNLAVLKMLNGQLKELEGVQNFENMAIMDFTGCKFLRKIPNVSRIPNLETLILDFCEDLVEVHHSVGFLNKLALLSVKVCGNLKSFPRSLKLRSLKSLFVCGSPKLVNFPEIECQMELLKHIEFKDTGIKDLPSSIGYLVGVKRLLLSVSTNLTNLPDSICQLQHLEELSLTLCTSIKQLPTSIGNLGRIKKLDLDECRNLMNLPDSIYQLQQLEILNLTECEQLREILRLPPNVVEVKADWCNSLAIFLEEPGRSQLLNMCDPPEPAGVSMASSALQSFSLGHNVVTKSDFLIQRDCPSRLKVLNLSHSAIVSLPTWLNSFVGLEELYLNYCKQLEEISELPPNIRKVYAAGCTSLKRFQSNNINDLPMLEWIDFSDCHGLLENMGEHLQIRLMSEGLPTSREFGCIFSGNKISDCLSHCKEVSNTNSCEIDINEFLHLDPMNTRFSFSAVIGTKNVPDQHSFKILVEVINNGEHIYFHRSDYMQISASSHHVWLNYHGSHHSQLKTDNLRVKFTCELLGNHNPPKSVFFKSCGFHLKHWYEE